MYTLAALGAAGEAGALRVAVVCVRGSVMAESAEHEIAVVVGPEAVAGSTRLKAGTAQKLVLNTISTVTMVRLGRTYAGLMVAVAPDNVAVRIDDPGQVPHILANAEAQRGDVVWDSPQAWTPCW